MIVAEARNTYVKWLILLTACAAASLLVTRDARSITTAVVHLVKTIAWIPDVFIQMALFPMIRKEPVRCDRCCCLFGELLFKRLIAFLPSLVLSQR